MPACSFQYLSVSRCFPSWNGLTHVIPKLALAIVESILTGHGISRTRSLLFSRRVGASREPFKTAPRRMAVRLKGVCKTACLPCVADTHYLRFDACGLKYIDVFATNILFRVVVQVRTRTETSNEDDTLDDVSSTSFKLFEVKLLR